MRREAHFKMAEILSSGLSTLRKAPQPALFSFDTPPPTSDDMMRSDCGDYDCRDYGRGKPVAFFLIVVRECVMLVSM